MGEIWDEPLDGGERLWTYVELCQAAEHLVAKVADPQEAHDREDWIHFQALRTIAATSTDVVSSWLAKAALKTREVEFPRWRE